MISGVDVSSFQGAPRNWLPIAGSIAFAGVKMTEYSAGARKYENPDAPADWAALKAAGHGRIDEGDAFILKALADVGGCGRPAGGKIHHAFDARR